MEEQLLSLYLYDLLCKVIGSEDVIRTRRRLFSVMEVLYNKISTRLMPSGSKVEGLDTEGSDFDVMILLKKIQVFENSTYIKINQDSNGFNCVMEHDFTKLGFTRLKLVNKNSQSLIVNGPLSEITEICGDTVYLSSEKIHTYEVISPGGTVHGPCMSYVNGFLEYLWCCRCHEWITEAQPWITRCRGSWPCPDVINNIINYGVLFVPVGCKNSKYEDLEWRISFSLAEKELIYSFNHTQMLCYAALKILLADVIKPKHGELLCSYFLKTVMFWLAEEIDQSNWTPMNFVWCIRQCFKRLLYCVEYKICLHYFIPEINFFEERFTDSEHKQLLDTLKEMHESEPKLSFIMQTKTIQRYKHRSLLEGAMFSTAIPILLLATMPKNKKFTSYTMLLDKTLKTSRLCDFSMLKLMPLVLSRESVQYADTKNVNRLYSNKAFYIQYKQTMCILSIGLSSDIVSGWCKLATVFYNSKQYTNCRTVLRYSLSKCTQDKFILSLNPYLPRSKSKLLCKKFFTKMVTHYSISMLWFGPDDDIPLELKEILDSESYTLRILSLPSVVYLHFLDSLCAHYLGNYMDMRDSVKCLELVIKERYFILDEYHLKKSCQCLGIAKKFLNLP